MHLQRTLAEIVHDVVNHLDAGMTAITVPEEEIADAIRAPVEPAAGHMVIANAVAQVCRANDLFASRDSSNETWVFRLANA